MNLTIDGVQHAFTPIKTFREAYHLPPEFGVAYFEPKDFTGLGRIDLAGAELNGVRAAVLAAIPARLTLPQALAFVPRLTHLFTDQLYGINSKVGLRDVEIEFAAAGFADVSQAVIYSLVRGGEPPPFEAIYGAWLDGTVRVSQTVHRYGDWEIQIVTHAYGRAGMMIRIGDAVDYVQDAAIGCPAEGYMTALLAEVGARLVTAIRG